MYAHTYTACTLLYSRFVNIVLPRFKEATAVVLNKRQKAYVEFELEIIK